MRIVGGRAHPGPVEDHLDRADFEPIVPESGVKSRSQQVLELEGVSGTDEIADGESHRKLAGIPQLPIDADGLRGVRHLVDRGDALREEEAVKRLLDRFPHLSVGRRRHLREAGRGLTQNLRLSGRAALDRPALGILCLFRDAGDLGRFPVDEEIVRAPAKKNGMVGNLTIQLRPARHGLRIGSLPHDPGTLRKLARARLELREDLFRSGNFRRLDLHAKMLVLRRSVDVGVGVDEAWEKCASFELHHFRPRSDEARDLLVRSHGGDPVSDDRDRGSDRVAGVHGDDFSTAQDQVRFTGRVGLKPEGCEHEERVRAEHGRRVYSPGS